VKNLKVGKKLIFSYAVILLLMIGGIAVGIVNLIHLGTQMETFYDGPYIVKGSANIINSNFEKMQKSVYRAMANADSEIIREANQDVEDAAAAIQEQLPIIKEHFLGDQQIVERLEAALAELAPMRAQVLSLASQNQNTEAAAYYGRK
jgi:methyl-accepting chemotaxis protein